MLNNCRIKYVPTLSFQLLAGFDWGDEPIDIKIPKVEVSLADEKFNLLFTVEVSPEWSTETAELTQKLAQAVQRDVEKHLGGSSQEATKALEPQITLTD